MKLTLTGVLTIEGLSEHTLNFLFNKYQLPNPDYEKAIRANPKARYALSPSIPYGKVFKKTPGKLELPRGTFHDVFKFLDGKAEIIDATVYDPTPFSKSYDEIPLRPYQEGVIEEILGGRCDDGGYCELSSGDKEDAGRIIQERSKENSDPRLREDRQDTRCGLDCGRLRIRNGIARLDTGFGKTIIAINLAIRLGCKVLLVVPQLDLLTQYKKDIRSFLGVEAGIIQGKKVDIRDFTITTTQTLQRRAKELDPYAFGTIIVDECHKTVPKKTRDAIEYFVPKYRYGFTGTARRSDGQGEALKWIYGPILVDRAMPRQAPRIEIIKHKELLLVQEYAAMITEHAKLPGRNKMIKNVLEKEVLEGRRVLVLTKRVEHYREILASVSHLRAEALQSDDETQVRSDLLERLKTDPNSFDVLLGTYALLGTGVDIPGLDTLILAGDLRSTVLAEQSAGRILRLFDDKKPPKIIDIQDHNNFILKRQSKERELFYKSMSWQVTDYEL